MLTSGLDRQLHEHVCTHIHIDKVEEAERGEPEGTDLG